MGSRIYVRTQGVQDWQRLLAEPMKHWRTGYSARALAHCWESASGFPPEIAALFAQSEVPAFENLELLLAIPEHKVILPPRSGHPSQNDLFALARAGDGQLMAMTVEGKVSEPFGSALREWNAKASRGKTERLAFIQEQLGLSDELPGATRYQLLHRTTSAVLEARRFNARYAAMVVQSFNQDDVSFDEYAAFLALFGVSAVGHGRLHFLREIQGVRLYSGWARGEARFLAA
jgi:hypothetical protein